MKKQSFIEVVSGHILEGSADQYLEFNEDTVETIKVEIKTKEGKTLTVETDFFQISLSDYDEI